MSSDGTKAQEGPSAKNSSTSNQEEEETLSMPWSDAQDWALRDQLPKYTVMIPLETVTTTKQKETEEMYSFCEDVSENVPIGKENFKKTTNEKICNYCNFREICL